LSAIIRPATVEDIPALVALVVASYRAAFSGIIGEAGLALRGPAYFTDRLTREVHNLSITTTHTGSVIGMAEVRDGVLDMLFVDAAATGQGHGAALLRDAEMRGARWLECFHANQAARRFYGREGWRETADYSRDFADRSHRFVAMEKP
jgi:putative acetyltransferase